MSSRNPPNSRNQPSDETYEIWLPQVGDDESYIQGDNYVHNYQQQHTTSSRLPAAMPASNQRFQGNYHNVTMSQSYSRDPNVSASFFHEATNTRINAQNVNFFASAGDFHHYEAPLAQNSSYQFPQADAVDPPNLNERMQSWNVPQVADSSRPGGSQRPDATTASGGQRMRTASSGQGYGKPPQPAQYTGGHPRGGNKDRPLNLPPDWERGPSYPAQLQGYGTWSSDSQYPPPSMSLPGDPTFHQQNQTQATGYRRPRVPSSAAQNQEQVSITRIAHRRFNSENPYHQAPPAGSLPPPTNQKVGLQTYHIPPGQQRPPGREQRIHAQPPGNTVNQPSMVYDTTSSQPPKSIIYQGPQSAPVLGSGSNRSDQGFAQAFGELAIGTQSRSNLPAGSQVNLGISIENSEALIAYPSNGIRPPQYPTLQIFRRHAKSVLWEQNPKSLSKGIRLLLSSPILGDASQVVWDYMIFEPSALAPEKAHPKFSENVARRVRLGDFGYFDKYGNFISLFNIFDGIPKSKVPALQYPESLGPVDTESLPRKFFAGGGFMKDSAEDAKIYNRQSDSWKFAAGPTSSRAAGVVVPAGGETVFLPHGSREYQSFYGHRQVLEHFRAHGAAFYKEALPRLPEENRYNGGLVFVGGVHLARNWAMVTFTANTLQLGSRIAHLQPDQKVPDYYTWDTSGKVSWDITTGPPISELDHAAQKSERVARNKCFGMISFSMMLNEPLWASEFANQFFARSAKHASDTRREASQSISSSFKVQKAHSITRGRFTAPTLDTDQYISLLASD